jgi:hypothetical protein
MAKILYAVSRRAAFGPEHAARLRRICERLEPDNLSLPPRHRIIVQGRTACAIANDRTAVLKGGSVLLGCLYTATEGWATPRAEYPDGSYALFRSGSDCLEAVSDAAASRTIWYCFDDERFVASTSQRAIVMFLGGFAFDERVVPWMLSTGSLGPQASWDRRIRRLAPDSSVVLDKERWTVSVRSRPIAFSPGTRSRAEHRALLAHEIRSVIQSLRENIRFEDYFLPLSGGVDSRAILCFLAEGGVPPGLRTITWGLESSLHRTGNDAAVAKALAAKVGARHRFFHTDLGLASTEASIERFIACAEGRIDHVSAYMDGLETWRKLLEDEGCAGIIRGDEGMGWIPVSSELTVRLNVGMGLCDDYRNLEGILAKFRLPPQELPAALLRGKDETLETWRDRLYHAYRLPTILAALSDIKYSYVDIVNPLLARSVLLRVRELPDSLRTHKALFRDIVNGVSPAVPYAVEDANVNLNSFLGSKAVAALVRAKLRSAAAKSVFDEEFLDYVLRGAGHGNDPGRENERRAWRRVKSLVPRPLKNWIRDLAARPSLDGNVLRFRVFLIVRMHEILQADCAHASAAREAPQGSVEARIAQAG